MATVGQTGAGIQVSGSEGVVKITGGTIGTPRSFTVSGSSDIQMASTGSNITFNFPTESTTLVGTNVTQSISNKNSLQLVSQDPLPTGVAGMMAVSSSGATEKLYFYNGSAWQEVTFV